MAVAQLALRNLQSHHFECLGSRHNGSLLPVAQVESDGLADIRRNTCASDMGHGLVTPILTSRRIEPIGRFQDFSRHSVVQFIEGQRPVGPASSLAIIKHAEEVGTPVEGPVR